MQYNIVNSYDNCSQSHSAAITQCNDNEMTTKNDSVRLNTHVRFKNKIRFVRTGRTMIALFLNYWIIKVLYAGRRRCHYIGVCYQICDSKICSTAFVYNVRKFRLVLDQLDISTLVSAQSYVTEDSAVECSEGVS